MSKKLSTLSTLLLMALLTGIATSCRDKDEKLAWRLSGEWAGDFKMEYTYTYTDAVGNEHPMTFIAAETFLKFTTDHLVDDGGRGMQVDFYDEGPYVYRYNEFDWDINNRVINIYYRGRGNEELDATIYDYNLKRGRFTGHFGDSQVRFSMDKFYTNDEHSIDWYGFQHHVNDLRDGWLSAKGTVRTPDRTISLDEAGNILTISDKK